MCVIINAIDGGIYMEVIDIIKDSNRNYIEEKEILRNFKSIVKSQIGAKEVNRVLEENGFQGIYIVDKDIYRQVAPSLDSIGFYDSKLRVILLDEAGYYKDKIIGIHEVAHAYLNGKSNSKIIIDSSELFYGNGLEEGAASLLMSTNNINKIENCYPNSYPLQSRLFQQASVLYQNSDVRCYKNLLVHLFKEPDKFISVLNDVYVYLAKDKLNSTDSLLGTRSAYVLMQTADILTFLKTDNRMLYELVYLLNSLYLTVSDSGFYLGNWDNKLFNIIRQFKMSNEEKLLYALFEDKSAYFSRQDENAHNILNFIYWYMGDVDKKEYEASKPQILIKK